jgi:predicted translin family RNA/ssDNA-binding protein
MHKVVFNWLFVMVPFLMILSNRFFWKGLTDLIGKMVRHVLDWFSELSLESVKTIKEFVVSLMLVGSSVATYVGFTDKENSIIAQVVAVIWFFICARVVVLLLERIDGMAAMEQLQQKEELIVLKREYHRKMAGTVRDIVRSELAKALKDEESRKKD